MNSILQAIQVSLEANANSKTAQPMDKKTYMTALRFLLKIASIMEHNMGCGITLFSNKTVNIDFRNPTAHLSINVRGDQYSYESTGPQEEDKMKLINNNWDSLPSELIEWLERNGTPVNK